jgi:hypothetical protein
LIMLSIYKISYYKNWLNKQVEFTVDNTFNIQALVLQELVKIIVVFYITYFSLYSTQRGFVT